MLYQGERQDGIRYTGLSCDEMKSKLTDTEEAKVLDFAVKCLEDGGFTVKTVDYWSHEKYENEFQIVSESKKDKDWKYYLKFEATTQGLRQKMEYDYEQYAADKKKDEWKTETLNKIWRTAKNLAS